MDRFSEFIPKPEPDPIDAYKQIRDMKLIDEAERRDKSMDIKTLEYLEDRAKKGREIVNKIEHLKKIKANTHNATSIFFEDHHGNFLGSIKKRCSEYPDQPRMVSRALSAIHYEIDAEIAELEQELAEL